MYEQDIDKMSQDGCGQRDPMHCSEVDGHRLWLCLNSGSTSFEVHVLHLPKSLRKDALTAVFPVTKRDSVVPVFPGLRHCRSTDVSATLLANFKYCSYI